jgi:CcmD family protein
MTPIMYVGAAYAAFWILLLAYLWRLTSASHTLARRVEELERELAARTRR